MSRFEDPCGEEHLHIVDRWPELKDVPTPDLIIIDLQAVVMDFNEAANKAQADNLSLDDIIDSMVPYIVVEGEADSALERFVSNTYDAQLAYYERTLKGKPVTSMYEEAVFQNKSQQVAVAVEQVGRELIRCFKEHKLYYENNAFYHFGQMQDRFSPTFVKSDIYFVPF